MIRRLSFKKQLGIGLLELMLSLAIISVLLVMATRYYSSARQAQQVNDAISLTEAIIAGSENWVIGKDNFSNISMTELVNGGFLPKGSHRDPWHGAVTVSKGGTDSQITITMQGVPNTACQNLASKLYNQTANPTGNATSLCGGSTFTATF